MKGLYKFFWNCGRMGDLEGVFVAEEKDVENLIGKHIYFGEVLGKHSEICGELESNDIVLLTDDSKVVELFERHVGTVGYNPFDYYYPEDVEENE